MSKKSLILLHGAVGSASQFHVLIGSLSNHFYVHAFDFRGHGADAYDGVLTMQLLAEDVIHYMDKNDIKKADLFGYSMGGYAALCAAIGHPERIHRITTLGTKWQWNEEIAAREAKMLDADTMLQKVPAFTEMLRLRHTGLDWKSLLHRTAGLMLDLGHTGGLKAEDLINIQIPVNICLGSEDRMVTREESAEVAACLPNGSFTLLEGVPHPWEKVDVEILEKVMKSFFED